MWQALPHTQYTSLDASGFLGFPVPHEYALIFIIKM